MVSTEQLGDYVQSSVDKSTVDFRLGQPGPGLLPITELQEAATHRFAADVMDPLLCQYGALAGYGSFRDALSRFLSQEYGKPVLPEDLLVTAGVSHGLDVAFRQLSNPGDCALVEDPTYFLAKGILEGAHVRPRGVPTTATGMDLDALRAAIEDEVATAGRPPALIYIIPTYNNPTGTTMPAESREELVAIAREHGIKIVADEVYQLLHLSGPPPPSPMRAFDPEGDVVVSAASFSKIFTPGLRLGWLEAGPPLMPSVTRNGVLVSGGCISPMSAGLAHSALELGLQARHLDKVRGQLRERRDALAAAIATHLPGVEVKVPGGGYFLWLRIPGIDGETLLSRCSGRGVGFCPGSRCQISRDLSGFVRLSFAFYTPLELEEGVQRLAAVLAEY